MTLCPTGVYNRQRPNCQSTGPPCPRPIGGGAQVHSRGEGEAAEEDLGEVFKADQQIGPWDGPGLGGGRRV